MEREEILTQYRLNPDAIVSYIEALESQVIELQERINESESLLNWIQGKKKRPSNGAFSEKKPKTEISQRGSSNRPGGQKGHSGSNLNKWECCPSIEE